VDDNAVARALAVDEDGSGFGQRGGIGGKGLGGEVDSERGAGGLEVFEGLQAAKAEDGSRRRCAHAKSDER
jgi:hypothetical protein